MRNEHGQDRVFRTFGIRHSALVILLTLVAGGLRFWSLDKPSIWGDEAQTWRRTSGSYQEMVDTLRVAGFMPGQYLITWWIKEGFPIWGRYEPMPPSTGFDPEQRQPRFRWLGGESDPADKARLAWTPTVRLVPGGINPTPFVIRLVPALCGTLMVPAIYFLASRLVARRTALLAALFAATSAYMLNYSRDAKMYAQLWFFGTLHVGCLLWWLEAYRRPAIAMDEDEAHAMSPRDELAAGVARTLPGEHVGRIGRAFAPSSSGRPALTMTDPSAYATLPLTSTFDVDPRSADPSSVTVGRLATLIRYLCWLATGLAMIAFQTVGLAVVGIELLIVLVTVPQRVAWIGDLARGATTRVRRTLTRRPALQRVPTFERSKASATPSGAPLRWLVAPPLVSFLLGASVIVATFGSYRTFSRFYERVEPTLSVSAQFDLDDAGIGWVQTYNRGRSAAGHYLENATAYLFNWEWVKPSELDDVEPQTLERLRLTSVVLLTAIVAGLLPWRRLLDRITGAPRKRGPMPSAMALLIVAAWLAVPAYGFHCASGAWDDAGRRTVVALPGPTLASAVFPDARPGEVGPLRGSLARLLKPAFLGVTTWPATFDALVALPWRELFVVRGVSGGARWWPLGALLGAAAICALAWRRPTALAAQLDESRSSLTRRRYFAWWASFAWHAATCALAFVILFALLLLTWLSVPAQEKSVWMPRYLGFVWPAFAIAVAALIRRLPLAPVRWLVVAALVGANLTNFEWRRRHGEPPTARIAADLLAADADPSARAYSVDVGPPQQGWPGSGATFSMADAYYTTVLARAAGDPRRGSATPRTPYERLGQLDIGRLAGNYANSLAGALRRREAALDEAYVWAQLPVDAPAGDAAAKLQAALAPQWQPAEPAERWMIYDHWTWRRLYVLERHHWRRAPTTRPATNSATIAASSP